MEKTPITIEQALAMVASIPDVVDQNAVKTRALAFEATRDVDNWRCAYPQERTVTIGDMQAKVPLAPIRFTPQQLAGKMVKIPVNTDVIELPAILVHALIGHLYTQLLDGTITPEPLPQAGVP